MAENRDTIGARLELLPRRPGVYLMKDAAGRVLYVGKAVDLRQRVRSYFQQGDRLPPKIRALTAKVADLDFTVTDNEVEALILESNLIKEYRPRYNINLKDDKHFPYLRLTVQEPFPRLHVTRRVEKDGARYFGPFAGAGVVRETLGLIRRLFPLRNCRGPLDPDRTKRPCLNSHIGRCLAPCGGAGSDDYGRVVDEVLLFLEGRRDLLLKTLKERMTEASLNMEYEKAARLRDQYRAVEALGEKQKVAAVGGGDRDILALAAGNGTACVQLFAVRGGKVTGRDHFLLTNPTGENTSEVLAFFLRRYYTLAVEIPPELVLSEEIPDHRLTEIWLRQSRGRRVIITVPQRGEKKALVRLAADNARLLLEQEEIRSGRRDPANMLRDLAASLGMDEPPYRIEGYDVSHLHGEGAAAAMVVFQGGLPLPAEYRRFRLRSAPGADDYSSLREALTRRFARLTAAREEGPAAGKSCDPFLLAPDLVLVDGGPGQLGAARRALEAAGLSGVPVVSLAKEEELVFRVEPREPLRLPAASPALQLLQHVRDEAHRFALTYQRTLRRRPDRDSSLLEVPGIGEKRRKALLGHFGSLSALRRAGVEELAAVRGMNRAVAENLYRYFQSQNK
jgi:excinuclease ABC subunit C